MQEVITEEGKVFNAQHLGLSAALGTYELSPLEFAQFWRVFLAGAEERLVASKVIDEVFAILSENRHRVVSF